MDLEVVAGVPTPDPLRWFICAPGSTVVTHRHDGLGRRVQRVSDSETLNVIYDGANLFREEPDTTLRREYAHYNRQEFAKLKRRQLQVVLASPVSAGLLLVIIIVSE